MLQLFWCNGLNPVVAARSLLVGNKHKRELRPILNVSAVNNNNNVILVNFESELRSCFCQDVRKLLENFAVRLSAARNGGKNGEGGKVKATRPQTGCCLVSKLTLQQNAV